MGMIYMSI